MTAGMNCSVRILRLVYLDDDVGGAEPTGTVLYSGIQARIDEEPANTQFLQQGLETIKIFSGLLWGHNLSFKEQDVIEVESPPNHEYFAKRFRVMSKTGSSNHPAQKRNVWIVKLRRSQVSHAEEFQ